MCSNPFASIVESVEAGPVSAPQTASCVSSAVSPGDASCKNEESLSLDPILARVEREAIRRALRAANWQRNKAARLMDISRSRLYRRMEALGIDPNEHE